MTPPARPYSRTTAPLPSAPAVMLSSIPVHPLSTEDVMEWIIQRAERREPLAVIATINLNFFTLARDHLTFARILREETELNVVDGWPVAWLLQRKGVKRVARAPGSDLTPALLKSPSMKAHGVFLLGDVPETLQALEERGRREGWSDTVRGTYSPSRQEVDDAAASERVVEQINGSGARVLLVAFGAPRQEQWLTRWRERLQPAVGIGVGGSFKFVAWPERRAPTGLRRLNLEWLHRFTLEPRRLGPRYVRDVGELGRLYWNLRRSGRGS